jgi:hypothetical protein
VTVEYFVPDGVWVASTNAPGKDSPASAVTLPEMFDVVTPCEYELKLIINMSRVTKLNFIKFFNLFFILFFFFFN